MLAASVRKDQMIHAEPTGAGQKEPEQDYEAENFGKVQEFREPAEQQRRFDAFYRGRRNRHNHYAAKHRARERSDCPEDE